MNFDKALKNVELQVLPEMAYGVGVNAVEITGDQLVDMVRKITEPEAPVKFTSVTDATYKKKNPLGTIYKVSQVQGALNSDYAKQKQAELDQTNPGAQYVAGKSYGTHESGSVVRHGDKTYIQASPKQALPPIYVVRDNIGKLRISSKEEVKPYLSPPSTTSAPTSVIVRRYQATSIVAIELDGVDHKVSTVDPVRKEILDLVNLQ